MVLISVSSRLELVAGCVKLALYAAVFNHTSSTVKNEAVHALSPKPGDMPMTVCT